MAQVDEFLAEMLPRWHKAYRALCERRRRALGGHLVHP